MASVAGLKNRFSLKPAKQKTTEIWGSLARDHEKLYFPDVA
jgi:hypothetical protein